MNNVSEITKAFRKARIAGEKMLEAGKITWDEYAFQMIGYELAIKSAGGKL